MSVTKLLSVLTLFVFAGCSNDDSDPRHPESEADRVDYALCAKGVLESDLTTSLALAGPGVDPETATLAAGEYHVATTYLALQPGKRDTATELSGPVMEQLFTLPGFVAVTLAGSASCDTLRTLTVWQSEEAMFGLVASEAHVRAMAQTSTISRGTSNTITWDGSAESATWDEAARQLRLETGGDI